MTCFNSPPAPLLPALLPRPNPRTPNSWNNTYNVVVWNRNTNSWRPVYWLGGATDRQKKRDAACGEGCRGAAGSQRVVAVVPHSTGMPAVEFQAADLLQQV
jgi:hypothetical protein